MFGRFRTQSSKGPLERREPLFVAHDPGLLDIRLLQRDRPTLQTGGSQKEGPQHDGAQDSMTERSSSRRARKRTPRRRSFLGGVFHTLFLLGVCGIMVVAGFVAYQASQLPPIDTLSVPKRPPNIAIVSPSGALLANRGDTGGRAVSLKELPAYLPNAFIAIEDRRFRSHHGIDPIGIARAVVRNVTSRGVAQGGSTLTQQLAKNLFLTQERTAARKIQEAILALWLERTYSKDQILELYLNRVYFGSGAYGVEAAAQRYFGKSARSVTLAEAAMLAGLVQAPSRLSPTHNLDAAQARAGLVLTAMADESMIDDTLVKNALMSPAEVVKLPGAGSVNYAADYVMDVLDDIVGSIDRDIVVTTTLEPTMQAAAEKALAAELDEKGAKFGVAQGAIISLDPNGAIRAMVGGRSYVDSQFNRATSAKRQPGSAFKPFVYLAAIESGLTPDTTRTDAPISIKGWTPENFSRDYKGSVTLREALAHSLNTVAVRLGQEVGPRTVVRTAQRLGIVSPLQANASIALGTSEVSPLELVSAYAPFANGGIGVVPYAISRVKTVDGVKLFERKPITLGRVIDQSSVGMMNSMMHETVVSGTAKKADLPGWEAAGKTGTSQDFRDAWFVGYTSRLVTAVWLGNDDGTPTKKASGATLPVEIWSRVMKSALAGVSNAPLPGGPFLEPAPAIPQASVPREDITGGVAPPTSAETRERQPEPQHQKGFLEQLFGTH